MAKYFPNLVNEKHIPAQEAERVPIKMNPKRLTTKYIIIKMAKVKKTESYEHQEKLSYFL